MNDTKWTPGPWAAVKYGCNGWHFTVQGRDGRDLALWSGSQDCGGWSLSRQDAHLIAAAPELYEALEKLLVDYDDACREWDGDALTNGRALVAKAESALKKARGES